MRFEFASLALLASLLVAHAAPIAHDEIVSKTAEGLHLLSLAEDEDPVWKTEDEKLELLRQGVQFFDVTYTYELEQDSLRCLTIICSVPSPSHQTAVNAILDTLSISNMQTYLSGLTAFNNRYYTTTTGAQASDYILNTVSDIISGRSDMSVSLYKHSWAQSSIILKIAGSAASTPVTIIGAHMDSINLNNPTSGRAPGADDDGTGTVNLLEALRALVAADYKPAKPVEFHWYSGEEAGLLGSQAIATAYSRAGVDVYAFMEMDMSGYFAPGTEEVFALEADYIDAGLNAFLGKLIDEYAAFGWTMDIPCGYACSDHASWYKVGYPTTFPYEAVTGDDDPYIHSASDTTSVTGFSWTHSLEFAKIVAAFAYELAPPA
ncbi:Zn-dependent exopeptidase [Hymenopellis radicata]|nr:Zn-dependent exopeptidase [Hymenopellis radicata]